jgi:hypothetical protein
MIRKITAALPTSTAALSSDSRTALASVANVPAQPWNAGTNPDAEVELDDKGARGAAAAAPAAPAAAVTVAVTVVVCSIAADMT